MSETNISEILDGMSNELISRFDMSQNASEDQPLMIGIHTGGVWVAEALHKRMNLKNPLGTLNISFYRDDFTRIGMHPQVLPSQIPGSVEGKHIILVDDVLYTGRTIRAAINEIFDYGRPGSITLATLIERDGRELPVQADVVGVHMKLEEHQQVKLNGPDPLTWSVEGGTP